MVYLREQIAAYKIDAVVVCRLIKVKNHTVDVPGQPYFLPYYSSFYGYYGAVYPIMKNFARSSLRKFAPRNCTTAWKASAS
jgi:hypothetical protein